MYSCAGTWVSVIAVESRRATSFNPTNNDTNIIGPRVLFVECRDDVFFGSYFLELVLRERETTADWRNGASPSERVHLQAYSAKGSGHEVSLVPSKTLDTYLTPSEFVNTVSRRQEVDVMDSGMPCCFCGHHLDAQGSHCSHVWRGGDATTLYNGVRDVYFDFCDRAGLRPISEAPNILLDVFTFDGRCRPADILCIPALALARVLPNGARAVRTEPVCMDIAVINALGSGTALETHSGPSGVRGGCLQRCESYPQRHQQQMLGRRVSLLADCA